LFIATPVLILPAIMGLGWAGVASVAINKWVMALGGMGHHLPGMMRAYGDRALFRRFKTRFVIAPLLLVVACVAFSMAGLHALLLAAYLWGVWHGLMQTHGFLRIYDAKVGSFAKRTARLDFLLCVSWFVGGVLFSDTRIDYVQEIVLSCGGPLMTSGAVEMIRWVAGALIGAVTVAYALHVWARRRAGAPVSPIKLLLAATSVTWWWYSNVLVADILIGIILFEIFHDVQYLTIVWLFNRSRVEKDPNINWFSKALFRRSASLLAIYIGLVFAYGALGPWAEASFSGTSFGGFFAGLVTASALLHFYYDGFIWKVRDETTRRNLGIEGGGAQGAEDVRPRLSPGARHGGKWLAFAIPVAVLGGLELRGPAPQQERAALLAELSPRLPSAQVRLGRSLKAVGDVEGTLAALEQAHALDPGHREAEGLLALTLIELGETYLRQGRGEEAGRLLHRAYLMDPHFAVAMNNEGQGLLGRNPAEAEWRFRAVIAMKPAMNVGPAWLNLAVALEHQSRFGEALACARESERLMPQDPRARATAERITRAMR